MLSYVSPKNEGKAGAELHSGIVSEGVRCGEFDSIEARPIVRQGSTKVLIDKNHSEDIDF